MGKLASIQSDGKGAEERQDARPRRKPRPRRLANEQPCRPASLPVSHRASQTASQLARQRLAPPVGERLGSTGAPASGSGGPYRPKPTSAPVMMPAGRQQQLAQGLRFPGRLQALQLASQPYVTCRSQAGSQSDTQSARQDSDMNFFSKSHVALPILGPRACPRLPTQ